MSEPCPTCGLPMEKEAERWRDAWFCEECGELWRSLEWGWFVETRQGFVSLGCLAIDGEEAS